MELSILLLIRKNAGNEEIFYYSTITSIRGVLYEVTFSDSSWDPIFCEKCYSDHKSVFFFNRLRIHRLSSIFCLSDEDRKKISFFGFEKKV